MEKFKTKAIKRLEERMEDIDETTLRYRILQDAKEFKISWIDFGQSLYSVWKDKLYKDWGYLKFDTYASKEIGIKKQTALKLLRSYAFLEKENPLYLKEEYHNKVDTAKVPTYEAVDVLRRASTNKYLDEESYEHLKKGVLDGGKDAKEAARSVADFRKQLEEEQPEQWRQKNREKVVKRFLSLLKTVKTEIKYSKILSGQIIKDAEKLITRIEAELSKARGERDKRG